NGLRGRSSRPPRTAGRSLGQRSSPSSIVQREVTMAKKEMLEAKRALRVGFDFALGMMRAAAQGTTTFVDARKRLQFSESASLSVVDFLQSAVQGAKESIDELKKEREEQN